MADKPSAHRVVSQFPVAPLDAWPYRWRTKKQEPARYGEPCQIVGRTRSAVNYQTGLRAMAWSSSPGIVVVVRFQDGAEITTSRGSVRARHRPWLR